MRWCSVVPIFNCYHIEGSLDLPFLFGDSIVLDKIPDWVKEERTIRELDGYKRTEISRTLRFALCSEYEANSRDDLDSDWKESPGRTKLERAFESFQFINLALWLAQPSSFSLSVVIHAQYLEETLIWQKIEEIAPITPHINDRDNILSVQHLERCREIYLVLANLSRRGSVWVAIRSLLSALTQSYWEVRFMNHWIVLESLFGPEDSRELSFRLAQRMAFFLSDSRIEAQDLFREIKDGYVWRSKVVHGRQLKKLPDQKSIDLMYRAEGYIRRALLKILSQPELIAMYESKDREDALDKLAFS